MSETVAATEWPPWRIKGLAAALSDVMVRGVFYHSRLSACIAYWEKRGELGPYPRDDHGHRRFGPADVAAIRARVVRWHAADVARMATYDAIPEDVRERKWTDVARRRHTVRNHRGSFETCDADVCFPYTPEKVARRAAVRAEVMVKLAEEPTPVPCEHPRTVDEGFWRICLDCRARWLPEVAPPEEPAEPEPPQPR